MPLSQIVSASIEDGAVAPVDLSSVAQYTGFKNRIINGRMVISQRSTSATTVAGTYVALDRFRTSQVTAAATTMSQSTDAPTGFQYSLRLTVNTADASVASSDVYVLQQIIEGFNVADLVGQTFTISFWVRSSKTGIHCISLSNTGVDRSYVAEYTIAVANTWEYKTITVSEGIPSSGTWNFTNGNGLDVRWALMGGTTFQTTANAWNNGNFTNTSSQVNVLDTIGNIFAITGVQLEKGVTATSFDYRPYTTELQLCQRYYTLAKPIGATYTTNAVIRVGLATIIANLWLPTTMRSAPTISGITSWVTTAPAATGQVGAYVSRTNNWATISGALLNQSTGLTQSVQIILGAGTAFGGAVAGDTLEFYSYEISASAEL